MAIVTTSRLLAAAALLSIATLAACQPAFAQNARSGSNSGAVAQIINDYGAGSGNSTSTVAGRTTTTVRTTPTVYAPTIAPASGCERPVSGGLSIIGIGAAAGTSSPIARCYAAEGARVYGHVFGVDVGQAYACRLDSDFRDAMRDIGTPCPQDRAAAPVSVTLAAVQPAQVLPLPPAPPQGLTPPLSRTPTSDRGCRIPGFERC